MKRGNQSLRDTFRKRDTIYQTEFPVPDLEQPSKAYV